MRFTVIVATLICVTSGIAQESIVRLHVIGAFGKARSECHVVSFRNLDELLPDGGYRDFVSRFNRLEGVGIPYGRYEAFVKCAHGVQGIRELQVSLPRSFGIIATNERKFRQHDIKPDLRIETAGKLPVNEVWWIRILGMFDTSDLTVDFSPNTGVAVLYDPKPGRYILMVHSDKGYYCSKLIDVLDAPRRWLFDTQACSFQFDDKAILVKSTSP